MEHAAHHARHTEQGVVCLGYVNAERQELVPDRGESKAADATEEEARGERTAATAAAVGGRGGEDF